VYNLVGLLHKEIPLGEVPKSPSRQKRGPCKVRASVACVVRLPGPGVLWDSHPLYSRGVQVGLYHQRECEDLIFEMNRVCPRL